MSEFVSRAQLLQTFEDLNKSFDRSLAGAKDKELQFESLRLGFIGNMSKHLQNAKVDLSDNHPLRPSLLAFIDSMDETRRSWNERIAGRDKGVKFREKFEDSLLVFVNGKVKSGKSSLGNYMAWGNTDPSDAMKRDVTAASAPVYFSEEKTNVKGGDADHEAETRREIVEERDRCRPPDRGGSCDLRVGGDEVEHSGDADAPHDGARDVLQWRAGFDAERRGALEPHERGDRENGTAGDAGDRDAVCREDRRGLERSDVHEEHDHQQQDQRDGDELHDERDPGGEADAARENDREHRCFDDEGAQGDRHRGELRPQSGHEHGRIMGAAQKSEDRDEGVPDEDRCTGRESSRRAESARRVGIQRAAGGEPTSELVDRPSDQERDDHGERHHEDGGTASQVRHQQHRHRRGGRRGDGRDRLREDVGETHGVSVQPVQR